MKTFRIPPVFTVTAAPAEGLLGKTFFAWTKGEARAQLRTAIEADKLPPGVVLTKTQEAVEVKQ